MLASELWALTQRSSVQVPGALERIPCSNRLKALSDDVADELNPP